MGAGTSNGSGSLKWFFPGTGGGIEDGSTNSTLQYFKGDYENCITREIIQNSLDARMATDTPVEVVFSLHKVDKSNIPDVDNLKAILGWAKDYSSNEDNAGKLYDKAIETIEDTDIWVLKASDYNTTGLDGDRDTPSSRWYKLVQAVGSNSKSGDAGGGSFGIGKGAPLIASDLKTVFYSSVDGTGKYKLQGTAFLSTYSDGEGVKRRGLGQCGIRQDGIEGGVMPADDCFDLPEIFRREQQGTDIHIMGYAHAQPGWGDNLLKAVLNNFWAAIHFGHLKVCIKDDKGSINHCVDADSLSRHMEQYGSTKPLLSHPFYKAVTNPTKKYSEKLELLGRVSLYVRVDNETHRKVQMMRSPLMLVCTESYRNLSDKYAGVFICKDPDGNDLLRELEPPAHDEWKPSEGTSDNAKKALRLLKKWIKSKLGEMAKVDVPEEDIPGISRYLPISEDEGSEATTDGGYGRPVGGVDIDMLMDRRPLIPPKLIPAQYAAGTQPRTRRGLSKLRGRGGHGVSTEAHGSLPSMVMSGLSFRARAIDIIAGRRKYLVVLESKDKPLQGNLSIKIIGEDGNSKLRIHSATLEGGLPLQIGPKGDITSVKVDVDQPTKMYVITEARQKYRLVAV